MHLSEQDIATLTKLEEQMWVADHRFDPAFQNKYFAHDFVEFGRSGKVYLRADAILPESAKQPILAELPLEDLAFRVLAPGVVQITYNSHVEYDGTVQHGRRSSIWSKTDTGWVMRFHQGTPYSFHED